MSRKKGKLTLSFINLQLSTCLGSKENSPINLCDHSSAVGVLPNRKTMQLRKTLHDFVNMESVVTIDYREYQHSGTYNNSKLFNLSKNIQSF